MNWPQSFRTCAPWLWVRKILAAQELIQTGAALEFQSNDTDTLKDALQRIISDDGLVAKLASAARKHAHTRDLTEWVDEHIALYDGVLKAAKSTIEEADLVLS